MLNLSHISLIIMVVLITSIMLQSELSIDNFFISIIINLVLFTILILLGNLNVLNFVFVTFFFFIISFDLIIIYFYIYNKFTIESLKLI